MTDTDPTTKDLREHADALPKGGVHAGMADTIRYLVWAADRIDELAHLVDDASTRIVRKALLLNRSHARDRRLREAEAEIERLLAHVAELEGTIAEAVIMNGQIRARIVELKDAWSVPDD